MSINAHAGGLTFERYYSNGGAPFDAVVIRDPYTNTQRTLTLSEFTEVARAMGLDVRPPDTYRCMDCRAVSLDRPGRCETCQAAHNRVWERDVARQEFERDAAADYYEPQEGLNG